MPHRHRSYPQFSACGLQCGLCPRYHTAGISKCPGCAGDGFDAKHPTCGVLSCSQCKEIEFCYQCEAFPCKKYDNAEQFDSFITHRHQIKDMRKSEAMGIAAFSNELDEKTSILEELLKNYDDGRRKSFFCTALTLLALRDVKEALSRLTAETRPEQPVKARAAAAVHLFQMMAEEQGISLKLRKRAKQ